MQWAPVPTLRIASDYMGRSNDMRLCGTDPFMKHMSKGLVTAVLGNVIDDIVIGVTGIGAVAVVYTGFAVIPLDVIEAGLILVSWYTVSKTASELAEEKKEALAQFAKDLNMCKCASYDSDAFQKAKDVWFQTTRPFGMRNH